MKRSHLAYFAVGLSFLLLAGLVFAFQGGGYHLIKKVSLGAAEGGREYFDYVTFDPVGRRVYLSHGTEFKVLDGDSYADLGSVTGLKRDHGVAIVTELTADLSATEPRAKLLFSN